MEPISQESQQFGKNNLVFAAIVFLLLIISMFLNLGMHPLYLEEPRRALIALEMIFRNNFIIPTEMGEYYYKKPPVYNWMLIASFKLFGSYSEFACRFFSVLSFIGMGFLVFIMGKKYVSKAFGIYAGLLFLVSVEIYFYFSVTGEIDLFYSFITLASFFTLFHFYEEGKFFKMFLFTYLLAAVGTLTKGFPSIVFLGITLPVFFFYKKDFKRIFHPYHFLSAFIYLLIVGGYFWYYSTFNGLQNYFHDLWSQSSERTVLENSVESFFKHLFYFPYLTLQNLLPAALFLIFAWRIDFLKKLRENKFIEFCFFVFISNVLIYWLSPANRSRYVYMLYPLLVIQLTWFYYRFNDDGDRRKIFESVVTGVLILITIACFSLPFFSDQIPDLKYVADLRSISLLFGFIMLFIIAGYRRFSSQRLLIMILAVVAIRFLFDLTVLPIRAKHSKAQMDKDDARRIAGITDKEELHIYNWSRFSLSTVFYIESERKQVLDIKREKVPGIYYLTYPDFVKNEKYKVFYRFYYDKQEVLLIKFL